MDKVLVSACLLGELVRYDAKDNQVHHALLERWQREGRVVSVCPEVMGGLPTPRAPAEIQRGQGADVIASSAIITTNDGTDVTDAFVQGANTALIVAKEHQCRFALMAARSPSCGNEQIYDGSFNGRLIEGQGATAALLTQNNIRVFNQSQIETLSELLDQ